MRPPFPRTDSSRCFSDEYPECGEAVQDGDRLLLITQDARPIGYKPETPGNWFRDRCAEAKVPGSLHGLRKAGVTRLADAGASHWEIASYLAHKDTNQADTCTKKANRSKLADSGFVKLQTVSNFSAALHRKKSKGE